MMPVHFKGSSEYKKHYKWFDSFRSKQFVPTLKQAADAAGRESINASKVYEPPLQHKKRLEGPPTSLSADYFAFPSKSTEFALLGQQDKFSSNVPYQLKNSASSSKIYKNKENLDDPTPPNKQLKMQKRIKPLLKEHHPPVTHSPRIQPAPETTPKSPPPAPRQEKEPDPIKEVLKNKDFEHVPGEEAETETKDVLSKEVKASPAQMNEFVQADLKKGQALSSSEAPADFALKYKARVAPPRPPKRFSEYQKQFQWKKGMKASPLLAAEQLVYRSSTDLGPYKAEPYSKVSEYKRQFQPWKPIDVNLKLENSNNLDKAPSKTKRVKRSKSAGVALHEEKKADAEPREETDGTAETKQKLTQIHGKIRHLGTEYMANFKSPTNFHYSLGAWKGANPPQLTPAVDDYEVEKCKKKDDTNPPLNNWFAEVIELRRRAEEYRKRAQGTHFSREHLVQLMARQTDYWDLDSKASSTFRALDLEGPKISKRQANDIVGDSMSIEKNSPQTSKEAFKEPLEEQKVQIAERKKRFDPAQGYEMAFLEEAKEKDDDQHLKLGEELKMDEEGDINVYGEQDEGRLPTPVLQQEKGPLCRHHLDLTTPAVGGALLTCPPSKNSKIIVTSRSGDSYVTASDNFEVKQDPKKTYNMDKLVTMPISGMPSGDTHVLRDDDASEDKILETRYVPKPLAYIEENDKENNPDKNVTKKKFRGRTFRQPELSSVQEYNGKTYFKSNPSVILDDIKSQTRNTDHDVMSVSMISVASSASLASEVLERTRKRHEGFWGKKD